MLDINQQEILLERLKQLKPDAKPVFGTMTVQHMIEHLSEAMRYSNGKISGKVYTPAEKLPGLRAFLMSEKEFPVGFKAPMLGDDLPDLNKSSIADAIDELRQELTDFEEYFRKNPDAVVPHPIFGELTHAEWIRAHNKHFRHHYKQFGLV